MAGSITFQEDILIKKEKNRIIYTTNSLEEEKLFIKQKLKNIAADKEEMEKLLKQINKSSEKNG